MLELKQRLLHVWHGIEQTTITDGMLGMVLLKIYFSFQQWKNFENPLRIDKVTAMSLVYTTVSDTQCI